MKAYCALSEKGFRERNEDVVHVELLGDGETLLAIIADGCGGENAGGVASRVTCKIVSDYLSVLPKPGLPELRMAMITANNALIELQRTPRYANMATVISACLIDDRAVHICHIGDTKIYFLKDNVLTQMTKEHSYVCELVDAGLLEKQAVNHHPRRHIITRFVGSVFLDYWSDYFYTASFPLIGIEKILLCSDGLYDVLLSDEIQSILVHENNVDNSATYLVERALENRSHDNISVIVINLNS